VGLVQKYGAEWTGVEAVQLTSIREESGLNLGRVTYYPYWWFTRFYLSLEANIWTLHGNSTTVC